MSAFLEIYLSSFWAWAGITWGGAIVLRYFVILVAAMIFGITVRKLEVDE